MAELAPEHIPQSCILFATADWDEPYWTNKQHCAKSLADLGVKVLYVESVGLRSPKAGSKRDWQRLWNRFRKGLVSLLWGAAERAPGIYVLSPLVVPAGHRHPVLSWVNRHLLQLAIKRSASQQSFDTPLIWTYHPFMLDAIEGVSQGKLLYHCVDDLAAVPGVDAKAFRAAEAQLLQRADVVFATAPSLAEYCSTLNPNTHFLPNVVDVEHFGKALQPGPIPPDLAAIPEPRLCYHGVLSDFKIDFKLLLDCARAKPEWSWVFIGEEREGQKNTLVAELKALSNVHFLGYKHYVVLPDYLRGMQLGLLPSLINEYTRGMFPMKYFEYIASGIRVVSSPISFTGTCCEGLVTAHDLQDFTAAIINQLECGQLAADEVQAIVGENTWHVRTKTMLDAVK